MNLRNRNQQIDVLRSIAISCIVLHHVLSAFYGWPPYRRFTLELPLIVGIICDLSKSMGLGIFTFISGYLLYFQNGKTQSFSNFCCKKTIRLIVPAIVVGIIYRFSFPNGCVDDWPSFINGNHLWYLPMLYLCILTASIDVFLRKTRLLIPFLFVILSASTIFFEFKTILNYSVYFPTFCLGYWFNKKDARIKILNTSIPVIAGIILVVVWFSMVANSYTFHPMPMVYMIESILVSIGMFCVSLPLRISPIVAKAVKYVSSSSFSIYLWHQFVINSSLSIDTIYSLLNSSSSYIVISFLLIAIFCLIPFCDYLFQTLQNR